MYMYQTYLVCNRKKNCRNSEANQFDLFLNILISNCNVIICKAIHNSPLFTPNNSIICKTLETTFITVNILTEFFISLQWLVA